VKALKLIVKQRTKANKAVTPYGTQRGMIDRVFPVGFTEFLGRRDLFE
jgi:hypothetical protein